MKPVKLAIAFGIPLLLAGAAYVLLRSPDPLPPTPGIPASEGIRSGTEGSGSIGGTARPGSAGESRVPRPTSAAPLVPGTRPVPDTDEAEVLTGDLIESLLADGSSASWLRIKKLLATGKIEDPDLVSKHLVDALGEGGNQASFAVSALAILPGEALRHRTARNLLTLAGSTRDPQTLKAAFEAIGQMGNDDVVADLGQIVRTVSDRGAFVMGLYAIAGIGSEESAELLARFLVERQGSGQEDEVVTAIGRLKSPGMVDALRPLIAPDSPPELRLQATRALAQTGEPRAMNEFQSIVAGEGGRDLKEAALVGLGRIGTGRAVSELLRIRREGGELWFAAGLAIGRARGNEAAEVILSEIDEEQDDRIKVNMIQALEGATVEGVSERLGAYVEASDEPPAVREYSARTLGKSGDPRAVDPLVKTLSRSDPNDRSFRTSLLVSLFNLSESGRAREAMREKALPMLTEMAKEKPVNDSEGFWIHRTIQALSR